MVDFVPTVSHDAALRRRRQTLRLCTLVIIAAAVVLAMPGRALALCHRAVFEDTDVTVNEGGSAQLVIVLEGGQAHCEGTVRVRTADGSAKAPGDYTAKNVEVRFVTADDRRESVTISTVNDSADEPNEAFTVTLSRGSMPGNITAWGPPATVRINDNDLPPPSPSPTPTPTRTPASTPTPTPTPTNTVSPSPTPTESETPTPTPTPTETDTGLAAPPAEDGGGKGGLIAAIAVAVILVAGGTGLWLMRRRYGFR